MTTNLAIEITIGMYVRERHDLIFSLIALLAIPLLLPPLYLLTPLALLSVILLILHAKGIVVRRLRLLLAFLLLISACYSIHLSFTLMDLIACVLILLLFAMITKLRPNIPIIAVALVPLVGTYLLAQELWGVFMSVLCPISVGLLCLVPWVASWKRLKWRDVFLKVLMISAVVLSMTAVLASLLI